MKERQCSIGLRDLSGFEGRCDALYFTKGKDSPPEDKALLEAWRNKLV